MNGVDGSGWEWLVGYLQKDNDDNDEAVNFGIAPDSIFLDKSIFTRRIVKWIEFLAVSHEDWRKIRRKMT